MKRSLSIAVIAVSLLAGARWSFAADPTPDPALDQARQLYWRTQYAEALKFLSAISWRTAQVNVLMGQSYYMLGDYKKAADAFEAAVQGDSRNSSYWDWLGRAYGKRAENATFITAPAYASKARQQFEKAVELDPANLEAVDDLFEYYLEAPGIVGGGTDKAVALADKLRERAPARYHSMHARVAEKQKQYGTAEQHLRQAIDAAPQEAGRLVDLARFLARRGRLPESDAMFERAMRLAPQSSQLKFQRARTYIESNRNLEEARRLLQEYLSSNLTPDDPPRSEATQLLEKAKG